METPITHTADRQSARLGKFEAPLLRKIAAPLTVAVDGRRDGDDLDGAAGLSARGDRLANAAENLASDGGRMKFSAYKSARS
jgi:hypothetical protein